MEKMIRQIIDSGFLKYGIDQQLQEDDVYTKDMLDAEQLGEYIKKEISEDQARLLDDYEAILRSGNARAQELAYILGIKNTITWLQQADALKII